ncbi:hypothetical protein F3628_15935 [Vibrio cholerae]|nr:hypothetical protein [Vibrio cholerae]
MGKQNIKHKYASLCGVIIYPKPKDKAAEKPLYCKTYLSDISIKQKIPSTSEPGRQDGHTKARFSKIGCF